MCIECRALWGNAQDVQSSAGADLVAGDMLCWFVLLIVSQTAVFTSLFTLHVSFTCAKPVASSGL